MWYFRCRRSIIARHFGEVWDRAHCKKMCDHCSQEGNVIITHHLGEVWDRPYCKKMSDHCSQEGE